MTPKLKLRLRRFQKTVEGLWARKTKRERERYVASLDWTDAAEKMGAALRHNGAPLEDVAFGLFVWAALRGQQRAKFELFLPDRGRR